MAAGTPTSWTDSFPRPGGLERIYHPGGCFQRRSFSGTFHPRRRPTACVLVLTELPSQVRNNRLECPVEPNMALKPPTRRAEVDAVSLVACGLDFPLSPTRACSGGWPLIICGELYSVRHQPVHQPRSSDLDEDSTEKPRTPLSKYLGSSTDSAEALLWALRRKHIATVSSQCWPHVMRPVAINRRITSRGFQAGRVAN